MRRTASGNFCKTFHATGENARFRGAHTGCLQPERRWIAHVFLPWHLSPDAVEEIEQKVLQAKTTSGSRPEVEDRRLQRVKDGRSVRKAHYTIRPRRHDQSALPREPFTHLPPNERIQLKVGHRRASSAPDRKPMRVCWANPDQDAGGKAIGPAIEFMQSPALAQPEELREVMVVILQKCTLPPVHTDHPEIFLRKGALRPTQVTDSRHWFEFEKI